MCFAHLTAPVVTNTIILSSNKIHNGDILVSANPGPPVKMAFETEREREREICITSVVMCLCRRRILLDQVGRVTDLNNITRSYCSVLIRLLNAAASDRTTWTRLDFLLQSSLNFNNEMTYWSDIGGDEKKDFCAGR